MRPVSRSTNCQAQTHRASQILGQPKEIVWLVPDLLSKTPGAPQFLPVPATAQRVSKKLASLHFAVGLGEKNSQVIFNPQVKSHKLLIHSTLADREFLLQNTLAAVRGGTGTDGTQTKTGSDALLPPHVPARRLSPKPGGAQRPEGSVAGADPAGAGKGRACCRGDPGQGRRGRARAEPFPPPVALTCVVEAVQHRRLAEVQLAEVEGLQGGPHHLARLPQALQGAALRRQQRPLARLVDHVGDGRPPSATLSPRRDARAGTGGGPVLSPEGAGRRRGQVGQEAAGAGLGPLRPPAQRLLAGGAGVGRAGHRQADDPLAAVTHPGVGAAAAAVARPGLWCTGWG